MEPTRISVEEAKRRFDTDEQIVFLDTRSPEAWRKAGVKIPGAVRVPPGEVEQYLSAIPRNRSVITYCT
jgi:rhodanese-related sulfurtransferase